MDYKVFVINLDHSKERWEQCKTQLSRLRVDFERVPAVNGSLLSEHDIQSVYDQRKNTRLYKKSMCCGEIACFLSHRQVWQKIIDENLDYAVVLEDDFALDGCFESVCRILPRLKNWDYIRLGDSGCRVRIVDSVNLDGYSSLVRFNRVPSNTLAQAVSRRGANKLLSSSQTFFRPVDVDIQHCWEKPLEVLGVHPAPVTAQDGFESDITKMSKKREAVRNKRSNFYRQLKFILRLKANNYRFQRNKKALQSYVMET